MREMDDMLRARIRILIGTFLICIGLIAIWPFIKQQPSAVKELPSSKLPEAPPHEEDVLSPTTFHKRLKLTFPNIYLTIISIIEGVAVYTLTANTYNYTVAYSHAPQLLGYFPYWLQYVPFTLTSFLLVVIVAYDYMLFVALFRWSPRLLDVVIPLGFGFFEILPMYYFTDPAGYSLTISFVCFCGAFAYWYSWYSYPQVDIAEDFTEKVLRTLDVTYAIEIIVSLVSGGVFLSLFFVISKHLFNIAINSYLQEILVWGIFIILEVYILIGAGGLTKDLSKTFGISEKEVPTKRWFPWLHQSP